MLPKADTHSFMNSPAYFLPLPREIIEPDNCIVHALEYNFALGYEQ